MSDDKDAVFGIKVTFEELSEQLKRLEGQEITSGAGLALHILANVRAERDKETA